MATDTPKTTDTTDADEQLSPLDEVVSAFKDSWEYTSGSYHPIWEDCFNLYNNIRIDRAYEGISDTFVPLSFTTIEVMVAAIAGGKPKFTYVPQTMFQEQDTRPINSLLDYYWDCDKWSAKVNQWIRSMLMYGTGVMYIYWDMDKPRLINVPVRDFFFDPTATDMDESKCAYAGRRYLTTIDELKSIEIYDVKTGGMLPKYSNLDQIVEQRGTKDEQTDKEKKDMFLGSTLGKNAMEDQVEVIEYWTKDRTISVANRSVVIHDGENPFLTAAKAKNIKNPKGIIPFICQRDYADESLLLGKGELEPISGQQEQLNDITNQHVDSITYALNPMFTLDPKYGAWIEKVENLPGAVYPFEGGALVPVPHAPIPPEAFELTQGIKGEIRETTAANEIFSFNLGGSKLTSAAINNVQAQVGQRFDMKVTQLENDGFHRLGSIVFKMIQLYMDKIQYIRVSGMAGVDWMPFDPLSYEGEYEPMVQLQTTIDKKQAQDTERYQALYTTMLNNPFVNQQELTKFILQKEFDLESDEVDLLTQNTPAQMQGMQPGGPGMPPGGPQMGPGGQQAPGAPMMPVGAPAPSQIGAMHGVPRA